MESITLPPMFILFVLEEKKMKLCNVVVFGPNQVFVLLVSELQTDGSLKYSVLSFLYIFASTLVDGKRGMLTLIL